MTGFIHTVQLRWGDFDALRHVNNVRYFDFMQDARVGLVEASGMSRDELAIVGHFVAHNEIDYLAPISMEISTIQVYVWIDALKGASYELSYEFKGVDGTLYAKAKTVMVTVDMASSAVIRIPDDLRDKFAQYVRKPE